ncbi:hypothetical protein SELMODRAFT_94634 [Selaginella moellendorffii]|uniref:Bulb-type lectin domain-containing protein n=1 Tax=Selaginella moellendorffii TaxID=88036 RepID=D8RJ54_SELML|nr:hypothetical protein SELMODRAFT_94634 [Selaginella moellendorffii]
MIYSFPNPYKICNFFKSTLLSGYKSLFIATLHAGEFLTHLYKAYVFLVQQDCNAVYYYKNIVLWNTKTYGMSFDCKFRLQEDGNFVLYSAFDLKPLYATKTYCKKFKCVNHQC